MTFDLTSSPLGHLRVSSGRLDRQRSSALDAAAGNLMDKAVARLDTDPDRAAEYVRKALALPFDEYEQWHPAIWDAHMRVFMMVSDDLEGCAPGDTSWLDRAEGLMRRSSPAVAREIRHCLYNTLGGMTQMSAREAARVKRLASDITSEAEPLEDVPAGPEQTAAVLEMLRLVRDHATTSPSDGEQR